ncbi:cytochrome c biogenesis CcdA family protein [Desulfoscipio geothermicus]|uniref:Cytochrome c-type biogenesis protein n=1 Tax=Desulfoscipio geothermicus DSM 3669 TaxID=1121426 RepID=A0A1I6D1W7_9FIRM|nr:cytochrome c biogenesis protein CcdA [Desulfoscipio geothermicus]SFQ99469.1 cytochrome c-type biogenesis protein [Desulfoscipio geothermicus DSM 3669]
MPSVDALLAGSLGFSLLAVLAAGLVSGLSPCTLPTVVMVVAYVGGHDNRSRLKGFILSLSFVLGLSLTLAAAGAFVSLAGKMFLGSSVVWYIAAFVAVLMGANMLGLFTLPSYSVNLPGIKRSSGVLGAFLLGIPFAIIASPCTTPVTATVLAYAATKGNVFNGFILLFVYAIGRSIPLLAAGTFTSVLKNASKFARVSEVIQKISGLALVGLGFYLLYSTIS